MRLILVCPGEADEAAGGLTEHGRRQAIALAGQIAKLPGNYPGPEAVWFSSATAARQTAEIVSRRFDAALRLRPELDSPPDAEVLLRTRENPTDEGLLSELHATQERTWQAVSAALSLESDAALAVVCDALTIATLICSLLAMPVADFHRMRIDPASLSVINFGPRRPLLASLNETCHLRDLASA